MRFSLAWLKTFLTTTATSEQISDKLTELGLEVESLVDEGKIFEPYKVVRVLEVAPHPDADKLKVCTVDCGGGISLQIVCGAPNVRKNMLAVLAPVGATLPGSSVKMKVAQIRGVESNGMLCSAKELGLSNESSGILDLDQGTPGLSLSQVGGFGSCVFDVSITPNRADCMGVYGMARDLAAAGLGVLKELPDGEPQVDTWQGGNNQGKVTVDLGELRSAMPHFMACGMTGVRNGQSPQWLKDCLISAGVEPISALVDITNYIAFSFARPLHVYDGSKVKGPLTVRFAREKEAFLGLNGKEYQLDSEMVVIADDKEVCSLGGIMGGMGTRCTDETQSVLIESALFDPIRIGKTGQKLKIISEARTRLERGVDYDSCLFGLSYAVRLIKEICGGTVAWVEDHESAKRAPVVVAWDEDLFKKITGVVLEKGEGLSILKRLGFIQREGMDLQVPSWRLDVSLPEDLVEEVLRMKGLEDIPQKVLGAPQTSVDGSEGEIQRTQFLTKHLLAESGLNEVLTYAFISSKEAGLFGTLGEDRCLENPLSPELSVMRPSLIPGLLRVLGKNIAHGTMDVGIFEMGSVYFQKKDRVEEKSVAGLLRGSVTPLNWRGPRRDYDFLDAKEKVMTVLKGWDVDERGIEIDRSFLPSWLHPYESGRLFFRGEKKDGASLGFFGTLHPRVMQELDLSKAGTVAGFEVNVDRVSQLKKKKPLPSFNPTPFPKVTRDFSFLMAKNQEIGPVLENIKRVDKTKIEKVVVFDIYQGKNLEPSQKAVAFRVWISSMEKTLTEKEITSLCTQIGSVCEQEGLILRS